MQWCAQGFSEKLRLTVCICAINKTRVFFTKRLEERVLKKLFWGLGSVY